MDILASRLCVVLCMLVCQAVADTNTILVDDGMGIGRRFDGIGGLSGGGATSKLLVNYPENLRDQILDFLFKPNFGASLQILKVEIGGDIQSTDGTESSHMHNSWEENYQRGYEWWLMKEAKKRNPDIKLYGLPWGFPGWLGQGSNNPYVNNSQTADYVVRWINGAKQVHGLTIDYVGLHNEGSWNSDYAEALRNQLDARGYTNCLIVAADGFGWAWNPSWNVLHDPKFAKAVFAIGAHYTGTWTSPESKKCNRPLWSSEDWSTFNDEIGGGCWARLLNQNYVNGYMTSTISWNLIASYYENLPYYRTGLMTAMEPWSGHYDVSTPIWFTAHTTQFTKIGWNYLGHEGGVGRLPKGGSYVTLVDNPSKVQDFTMVLETMSHDHSKCVRPALPEYTVEEQTLDIEFKGNFSKVSQLNVWKSQLIFDENGASSKMFIKQDPLKVSNGKLTITLGVDEVWTLTTVNTGHKGAYADPPASKPFPLPYSDNFEAYSLYEEPYNLAQQTGSYEVLSSNNNKFVRQTTLMRPVHWCEADNANKSINVIGDSWKDIFVEIDFSLPLVNGSTGAYIAGRVDTGGCHADSSKGVYFFALTDSYIVSQDLARSKVVKQGSLSYPPGEWHKLSLLIQGSKVSGAFDGKGLFNVTVSGGSSSGFASIGTDSYALVDFDNLHLNTKENGQLKMKEYFKSEA